MTNDTELKPCPFCGSEAKYHYRDVPLSKWRHAIVCVSSSCGMEGPIESSKPGAVELWNRRALEAPADRVEKLEAENARLLEQLGRMIDIAEARLIRLEKYGIGDIEASALTERASK